MSRKLEDLAGKRFGRLVIVRRAGSLYNRSAWLCICDCGNEKVINGNNLKRGNCTSCGCYRKEMSIKVNTGNIYTLKDLTGKRFGRLLVIERTKTPEHIKGNRVYWLCRCNCGNEKIISGLNLRNGHTLSCGCYKKEKARATAENLIGKRFGKVVVIKRDKTREGVYWICKCDCGNEKSIPAVTLKTGKCISCGCYRFEANALPKYEAAKNRLIEEYINKSKEKNIVFELTREEFFKLTEQDCFYCGVEPYKIKRCHSTHGDYIYNGIDRIDSSKGYVLGNVVPCCHTCNFAKRTMEIDEFMNWVEKVYNHLICLHSSMDKSNSLLS